MIGSMASMPPRYRAFISYSHADARVAGWLHAAIERYRLPARLVGQDGAEGVVPARLNPVFIDRTELAASGSLGSELEAALAASRFLIVVCTPATVASQWVDEEIRRFKRLHGEDRVLALIAAGEPYASRLAGRAAEECFPACLRFRIGPDGTRSETPAEPLAADLREHGDGRRLALLKLIAALAGTRLDDLIQREAQRRLRRLTFVAAASFAGMILTGGLAFYANQQRIEAERQTATANAAVDYLVGTFEIVNPATENPKTITALTLLQRSAARAEADLASQPAIRARLIDTVGRVYNNLGLYREASETIGKARPLLQTLAAEGAPGLLTLATARLYLGDLKGAMAAVNEARVALPDRSDTDAVRARAAEISGSIHAATAEQQAAVNDYAEAERLYARVAGTKPETIAKIATNRGVLLTDMGRYADAERSLSAANAIYLKTLGNRHMTTGLSWNALAYNSFSAGKPELAADRIGKALAIFGAVLDADSPVLAGALSLRGQIEQQAGAFAAAKASLDQAIAIYRARFGPYHYLIGISLVYRAMVAADLGDTAAALADLAAARVNYDRGYGRIHANHGDLLVNRALVLARAGRSVEARADCAEGLRILDSQLGESAGYTRTLAAKCASLAPRAS
jgi:tetratricopeptide (TPR) repeat protein